MDYRTGKHAENHSICPGTHIVQMLGFQTANAPVATAVSGSSTAYKAAPNCSTSAMTSGLGRLFQDSTLGRVHGDHRPSTIPEKRRELETSTTQQRRKARDLDIVQMGLDKYLEEETETFTRTEKVGNEEQTVIFDILAYW